MQLAVLRFFESLPSALAVGLLLLPRLIGEDGANVLNQLSLLSPSCGRCWVFF